MLDGNWPFLAVFQKPQVGILQFIMVSVVDLWLQRIITIPEIPILGGICSFAAVFPKPEVAIFEFKWYLWSILAPPPHSLSGYYYIGWKSAIFGCFPETGSWRSIMEHNCYL